MTKTARAARRFIFLCPMSNMYVDEEYGSKAIYYMALFPRIQHRINFRCYMHADPDRSTPSQRSKKALLFHDGIVKEVVGFEWPKKTAIERLGIQPSRLSNVRILRILYS